MDRFGPRRQLEAAKFLNPPERPSVDLRLLEYAATPDENLVCPICRSPFIDPVVLTECDHCFCRGCIRRAWENSSIYSPLGPRGKCPTCRTEAKLGPRAHSGEGRILANILDDLLVCCPRKDEGCEVVTKRGHVQVHVDLYCGFEKVDCVECGLEVRRRDASRCEHVEICCLTCRQTMNLAELEWHLARCGSSEPEAKLLTCPGVALGCNGLGEGHVSACSLAKVAPALETQSVRLEEHQLAQTVLWQRLQVLERGYGNLRAIMHLEEPPEHFSPEDGPTPPYTSPVHHLLSMHEALREELARVSAALHELDGRHSMQNLNENLRTREEVRVLGAQVAGLARQVHWLTACQWPKPLPGIRPNVGDDGRTKL
ncbi:hypothetical protein K470DRAFT_257324 [Piedraia hortae CBS 480.64]|uniref:RING-type domain-containing protein n=1 Tax=Piedraia hortae CBS 480.64 TaxID=1314780 RepID=A0A6A7C0D3_9PEZI|nr:hypothetical protein K470DRAFT_257324 [Piedraia hortae CBS 480.64]